MGFRDSLDIGIEREREELINCQGFSLVSG